jgi:hypothetical protein
MVKIDNSANFMLHRILPSVEIHNNRMPITKRSEENNVSGDVHSYRSELLVIPH